MKKIILLIVFLFVFPSLCLASEIPKNYYQKYDQKLLDLISQAYPDEEERLKFCLDIIKTTCKWGIKNYKEDFFDCSEQSALVEHLLERLGFDTYIVIGSVGNSTPMGHAWVMVKLKDKKVYIESTLMTIIPEKLIGKIYRPKEVYSSIYDLPTYWLNGYRWWDRGELKEYGDSLR